MKLLIILLVICVIFPGLKMIISNGLIGLLPVVEAFMPCLIIIAGLYILVKRVLK